MRLALDEARTAARDGDVPVGAVVLAPDGTTVLARGHNEREAGGDPTAHAEVLAVRRAAEATGAWRLSGCTLVVTLEPCTMCAGALVQSRVDRVVYGARDDKAARPLPLGRRPRPTAQSPARGDRGRARDGVRATAHGLLPRALIHPPQNRFQTGPYLAVRSPSVACPSGRRSSPRKRVWRKSPRVQIPPLPLSHPPDQWKHDQEGVLRAPTPAFGPSSAASPEQFMNAPQTIKSSV